MEKRAPWQAIWRKNEAAKKVIDEGSPRIIRRKETFSKDGDPATF